MSRVRTFLGGGKGRALLVLSVALLVGLLAAWAARAYLGQRMAEIEAQGKVKMVSLVVAKHTLTPGERLSSDNLAVRSVPSAWQQSLAVTPEQFDGVEGQAIGVNLNAGEMLMWPMLMHKSAPTFSARVASGRRAVTVPVDEINSISGMLEPEDRIDLLLTLHLTNKASAVVLMRQIRVLATGQRVVQDKQSDGNELTYSTVTLDVTPKEAENLILAREVGKLTALLRHPEDRSGASGMVTEVSLLIGSSGGDAGVKREIPILYGGSNNTLAEQNVNLPAIQAELATAQRHMAPLSSVSSVGTSE